MVSFFTASAPQIYSIKVMLGFVEELVVFKRIEKEAENLLLIHKKYLKLRRKLANTVRKRGGNAIVSYRQVLDNEG